MEQVFLCHSVYRLVANRRSNKSHLFPRLQHVHVLQCLRRHFSIERCLDYHHNIYSFQRNFYISISLDKNLKKKEVLLLVRTSQSKVFVRKQNPFIFCCYVKYIGTSDVKRIVIGISRWIYLSMNDIPAIKGVQTSSIRVDFCAFDSVVSEKCVTSLECLMSQVRMNNRVEFDGHLWADWTYFSSFTVQIVEAKFGVRLSFRAINGKIRNLIFIATFRI